MKERKSELSPCGIFVVLVLLMKKLVGESFIVEYKDVMNITGAYVDPTRRGKGLVHVC